MNCPGNIFQATHQRRISPHGVLQFQRLIITLRGISRRCGPILAVILLGWPAPRTKADSWTNTSPMPGALFRHTATLLRNGKVLVAGGAVDYRGQPVSTAELYDPVTGSWSLTGSLTAARNFYTATLLPDGKVLAAGGYGAGGILASAELYDPASGTWTPTGGLAHQRDNHTATLLANGKVLVVGGYDGSLPNAGSIASAELYDPDTGSWTTAGALAVPRALHSATLLFDGKVLVAGGENGTGWVGAAELYDPVAATWALTGSLIDARQEHTATLLPSGEVLVASGGAGSGFTRSAELYHPAGGTWTSTGPTAVAHGWESTASLLPDGQVLVTGGGSGGSATELYNRTTATWLAAGALNASRYGHTATVLTNGQVLVAGGWNTSRLAGAELYDSAGGAPVTVGQRLAGGGFQLTFTGTPHGTNTVLATADLTLPSSQWADLGTVPEWTPGLFMFTDLPDANNSQRFYRVRAPSLPISKKP